jgi:predicted kinase
MLHLLCGKIAAGKSTLSAELAAAPGTVTLAEDAWLARLYPGEIRSVADYVRCAARLRDAVAPHVESLLRAGVSVVLDFPANTPASRAWMRGIAERSDARHRLYWLDVPEEVCRARLRQRNAAGAHDFAASDAEFDAITAYFVAPQPDEGLEVERRPMAGAQ